MSITGSNNPFPCSPVVFSAGNSIISLGTITRVGNVFTFSVGFVWKINGTTYQNASPIDLTIEEAADGFFRIDNALLTTTNTIELQQGLPSETIALRPTYPENNILLTSWNISGDTIDDSENPIVGTDVVKKSFANMFEFNGTGANAIIPFNPNGYSEVRLINAGLTSVSGFDLSLMTAPNSEFPYQGKEILIWNRTGGNVTLKHEDFATADSPMFLRAETDLVLPDNHVLTFKYDPAGLQEKDKSFFSVDEIIGLATLLASKANLVSGKIPAEELPSYVDDILEFADLAAFPVTGETSKVYLALDTNLSYRWSGSTYVDLNSSKLNKVSTVDVQKVYVKNADGTQGMKPVSEIGGNSDIILNYSYSIQLALTTTEKVASVGSNDFLQFSENVTKSGSLLTGPYHMLSQKVLKTSIVKRLTFRYFPDGQDKTIILRIYSFKQNHNSSSIYDSRLLFQQNLVTSTLYNVQSYDFVTDDFLDANMIDGEFLAFTILKTTALSNSFLYSQNLTLTY